MIEQVLYEHLQKNGEKIPSLAKYNCRPAIFNQEVPSDMDEGWCGGPQYGRIVFAVDLQGDPERDVSASLMVDIMCKENEQYPEDIEPIVRELIDGYFFSNGKVTMAAQWRASSPFTEATDHVSGCTVTFDLLAFPILTTGNPDVIARINEWTAALPGLHVINYDDLPESAWKPNGTESAVYWYLAQDRDAGWIRNTFQTIWRTAIIKCHIFSADIDTAAAVAREIVVRLYAAKRLLKSGESPIMVNQKNTLDYGADQLRTGQVTVEATYGIIVRYQNEKTIQHIESEEKKGDS